MPFSNDEQILTPEKSKSKKIILVCSIGLFITALFNTAICNEDGCKTSIEVLLAGFITVFLGGENLCWLANPFLVIAWVLIIKNKKAAWTFALVASSLALLFLVYSLVLSNEISNYDDYIKLKPGFWLWFLSCIITLIGSVFLRMTNKK